MVCTHICCNKPMVSRKNTHVIKNYVIFYHMKLLWQKIALNGVIPQFCLSDNAAKRFTAKEFTERLTLFDQIIRFAGVGAHHHNINAECSIRTIMSIACTMILHHSTIHWPEVADSMS